MNRGEAAGALALRLARTCRASGLAVEVDHSDAAFGKQFRRADRSGARCAAVIGDDEAAEGLVRLQDLRGARRAEGEGLLPEEVLRQVLTGREGLS